MSTKTSADLALARLMQLISPSLPIGGYSYSQGIEWAVEAGWIANEDDLQQWLGGLIDANLLYLDLPLLQRMLSAWSDRDLDRVRQWSEYLLASRETRELRLEEVNRARAFSQLLLSLEADASRYAPLLATTQMACYSFACERWHIEYERAACGLLCSWLENLVLSAVKIIPLGQTAGQRVIYALSAKIPEIAALARDLADEDIGASSMAMAIASARHESQYTRLFRS